MEHRLWVHRSRAKYSYLKSYFSLQSTLKFCRSKKKNCILYGSIGQGQSIRACRVTFLCKVLSNFLNSYWEYSTSGKILVKPVDRPCQTGPPPVPRGRSTVCPQEGSSGPTEQVCKNSLRQDGRGPSYWRPQPSSRPATGQPCSNAEEEEEEDNPVKEQRAWSSNCHSARHVIMICPMKCEVSPTANEWGVHVFDPCNVRHQPVHHLLWPLREDHDLSNEV